MASFVKTYKIGAALPALVFRWQVETAPGVFTDLDLSSGYTITSSLTAFAAPQTVTAVQAAVGSNGFVTQGWAVSDLLNLPAGDYYLKIKAVEIATSKPRWLNAESWPVIQLVA
jgi:hypothetical protein